MRMYSPIPTSGGEQVAPLKDTSTVRSIGIVDDNLDPALMDGLMEHLREALPDVTVRQWIKPSGTAPAPESIIDEMAQSVDVAIAGVAMCGSCTAGVMLDAVRLHKKGIPTRALSWEIFERSARSMAKLQGVPELPLVIIPKVAVGDEREAQRAKGRACAEEIVEVLSGAPVGA